MGRSEDCVGIIDFVDINHNGDPGQARMSLRISVFFRQLRRLSFV